MKKNATNCIINVKELPKQLHIGDSIPLIEELNEGRANIKSYPQKPLGGLWTANFHEKYGSSWVQRCSIEDSNIEDMLPKVNWKVYSSNNTYMIDVDCWIVVPDSNAVIFKIDCYSDYMNLLSNFGKIQLENGEMFPDYKKVSEHIDIIYLTDNGLSELAEDNQKPGKLDTWEVSSTIFLTKKGIKNTTSLGTRTFEWKLD